MDKKTRWFFVGGVIAILIIFPFITNTLMFFNTVKVAGDDKTWIGFIGSFGGAIIGGVISGAITLIGVTNTINHNEEVRKKENFPNKLYRLERLISQLEKTYSEFESMMAMNSTKKKSFFFFLDNNCNIYKTEEFNRYTDQLFEKLNEDIVYVDSKSYRMFFDFRRKVNDLFQEEMWDVHYKLFEFSQDLIEKYYEENIDPMKINLEDFTLNKDEKMKLDDLKRQLNKSEKKYIYLQSESLLGLRWP